jgi:ATP-dependent DNA helicase DinG
MNFTDYFNRMKLTARPQQIEVLAKLEQSWKQFKYFAVSAPPGVGKSHIALAIADAIPKTYLLTGTKYLQEQYIRTSAKVVDLKGRSNYTCNINPVFTADEAPCIVNKDLKRSCIQSSICDYYNQKKKALDSQMMITNYAYFLTVTANADEETEWVQRSAIIMDEAHDLEKHLISIAEIRISLDDLYNNFGVGNEEWRFSADSEDNRKLLDTIMQMMQAKVDEMEGKIEAIFNEGTFMQRGKVKDMPKATGDKIKKIQAKQNVLKGYVSKIMVYFATREFTDSPWVETPNFEENSIVLSPLTSKYLFKLCMDDFAEKFVFMSATLPPKEVLCKEMGIDPAEMFYVETGTPFPAEKSPVIILPVAKMNYKELANSIPLIVQAVEAILDGHPNEKGLIHTGNYKIATEILNGVDKPTKKRLIARDMGGAKLHNNDLLKLHSSNQDPTVLLSPSMTTGIDLYDDLARFQIIVKLPFPSLGDARIKRKSETFADWYTMQMWMEVLQASCRATRSVDDHSTTYILDASFLYFFNNAKSKLPGWFKERIQM